MNMDMAMVLMSLLISVGVFLLCREILCWYFKINEINKNLEAIKDILQRVMAEKIGAESVRDKE